MKRLPQIALLILIIGVIATILIPIDEPSGEEIFKSHSEAYMRQIIEVLNYYHSEIGVYPDSLEQLVPKYLNKISRNPWDEPYQYYSQGSRIVIFTVNEFNPIELIYVVHNKDI